MQQGSQCFTLGLIELGLDCFRSARLLFETRYAFLLKRMDGIAHSLRRTTQVAGDYFRALLSTGG